MSAELKESGFEVSNNDINDKLLGLLNEYAAAIDADKADKDNNDPARENLRKSKETQAEFKRLFGTLSSAAQDAATKYLQNAGDPDELMYILREE